MTTYNFNAGPAQLPKIVLEQVQEELLDYQQSGMSVMELSHRSPLYEKIHYDTISRFQEILGLSEDYEVLLLQGGASTQFAMVPMNFGGQGEYYISGSWSQKAWEEASRIIQTRALSQEDIPESDAAYVHITSNETIEGTQLHQFPDYPHLIGDMSSDFLSRPVDLKNFDLIYAGAQKNVGPAGVTIVILKKEALSRMKKEVPNIFSYHTHIKLKSLYHTPPTFSIYIVNLVLKWIQDQGGLSILQELNEKKANLIYQAIDQSHHFYQGTVESHQRSYMNITFRLATSDLELKFLTQAKQQGFVGLEGHRSIGGIRASLYNAVSLKQCKALYDFMVNFQDQYKE